MRASRVAGLLLLAGCETAGRAERAASRDRELHEVNRNLPPERHVVPPTAREQNDPLRVDPRSLAKPERAQR
jgi:hypothetical protein